MFRKLLVPLDRSPFGEQALGPATIIARASPAEIDLVLVHEPRPLAGSPDVAWHAELIDGEDEYLAEIADELAKTASVTATHAVLPGEVVAAICKRTRAVNADLVVMTTHGRTGINRAWVGSVADGVLRKSGVPVLMWRPKGKSFIDLPFVPFRKILVLTDGSAASMEVMRSAVSLAKASGAKLSLLRIVQPLQLFTVETAIPFAFPVPAEDEITTERTVRRVKHEMTQLAHELSQKNSIDVESYVLVSPDVASAIIDVAVGSHVDVVAMSTHGRGSSRLIVGSVADKIIRSVPLPMLLQSPAVKSNGIGVADAEALSERTEEFLSRPLQQQASVGGVRN